MAKYYTGVPQTHIIVENQADLFLDLAIPRNLCHNRYKWVVFLFLIF